MYYEVKNKISSILVQLYNTTTDFKETKWTATKCEGLQKREE